MDDLGEAIDGFLIEIVEAMDEDEHAPALRNMGLEPGLALLLVGDRIDRDRREFLLRIGGQALRPLDLADLAMGIGRDGDRHRIDHQAGAALAGEKDRLVLRRRPGRGGDQLDLGGAVGHVVGGLHHADRPTGTRRQAKQQAGDHHGMAERNRQAPAPGPL